MMRITVFLLLFCGSASANEVCNAHKKIYQGHKCCGDNPSTCVATSDEHTPLSTEVLENDSFHFHHGKKNVHVHEYAAFRCPETNPFESFEAVVSAQYNNEDIKLWTESGSFIQMSSTNTTTVYNHRTGDTCVNSGTRRHLKTPPPRAYVSTTESKVMKSYSSYPSVSYNYMPDLDKTCTLLWQNLLIGSELDIRGQMLEAGHKCATVILDLQMQYKWCEAFFKDWYQLGGIPKGQMIHECQGYKRNVYQCKERFPNGGSKLIDCVHGFVAGDRVGDHAWRTTDIAAFFV